MSMLAPSLAAPWKTTHRFNVSRSDSAFGRGESPVGRSTDPRGVVTARNRRLRTYGLAISAGPSDGTVTDLAYVLREPRRRRSVHADGDVVVCAGRWRRRGRLWLAGLPSSVVLRCFVRSQSIGGCRLAWTWLPSRARSCVRPFKRAKPDLPSPAAASASGHYGVQPAVLRPCRHQAPATDNRVQPFARPTRDRARQF